MNKIDKKNADMFESVFGNDMAAKNVETEDKTTINPIQMISDQTKMPISISIIRGIFSVINNFITYYIPFGFTVFACFKAGDIFDKDLWISILKIICAVAVGFCASKAVEFALTSFFLLLNTKKMKRLAKENEQLKEMIKTHLAEKDNEQNVKKEDESDKPLISCPNRLAEVTNKIVDRIISSDAVAKTIGMGASKASLILEFNRHVSAILYNIYANGLTDLVNDNDKCNAIITGDYAPNELFVHTSPTVNARVAFRFIVEAIRETDWFKKPLI